MNLENSIEIEVIDTGIGMEDFDLENFTRFTPVMTAASLLVPQKPRRSASRWVSRCSRSQIF